MDEITLTPIYRIEHFLDAIVNSTDCPYEARDRIELFLERIAGADIVTPEPQYRIEFYLAKIAGDDVEIPEPQHRAEFYLAALCGEEVELPEPHDRIDYWLYNWAEGGSLPWATFTGNPLQFNAPKAHVLKSVKVEFSPIQSGSGDPSPDNVRPISGWTGVTVLDDPAYGGTIRWNQLAPLDASAWGKTRMSVSIDGTTTIFTATSSASSTKYAYLDVPQNSKILVSWNLLGSSTRGGYIGMYDYDSTDYNKRREVSLSSLGIKEVIYTSDSTYHYIRFQMGTTAEADKHTDFANFQIFDLTAMFGAGNEPATVEAFRELFPKDYYAYDNSYTDTCVSAVNGNPYWAVSVTFTDQGDPLTVYGGTASVAEDGSGQGSDEWIKVSLNIPGGGINVGTSSAGVKYADVYYSSIGVNPPANSEALATDYKWIPTNETGADGTFKTYQSAFTIYDNRFTDVATARSLLASVEVACKRAYSVPFTPTVTGQPTALKGINTMWTDGSNLTVEARAEAVNLSALQSLNMLLGGRYYNNGTSDEPTDEEALNILLGGNTK